MEAIVYHGSSRKLQRFHGYTASKKKDRMQYGCGLYTTTSYRWANVYGRCLNTMRVELDPSASSRKVQVTKEDCIAFIGENISQKQKKHFIERFEEQETLTAYEFQFYLLVFYPKVHLIGQALNDWFVSIGVQYTVEHEIKGDLVLIHDFRIIREMVDAADYGFEEQPRIDKELF